MLRHARRRAERVGVPFRLKETDIVIPSYCPVLGIPLEKNKGGKAGADNSPSLDRIIPRKGYVKGNVIVISYKANRIKNDATVEELKQVASFYSRLLKHKGSR